MNLPARHLAVTPWWVRLLVLLLAVVGMTVLALLTDYPGMGYVQLGIAVAVLVSIAFRRKGDQS
jgi:hypothetical protein